MAKSTVHGGASNEAEEVDVNIGAPTIGEPRVGEGEPVEETTTDDAASPPEPAKKAAPKKTTTK